MASTATEIARTRDTLIRAELIGQCYRDLWPILANFIISLIVWRILGDGMPAPVQPWFLGLAGMGLVFRLALWAAYRRLQPQGDRVGFWGAAHVAGLVLTGLQWGLASTIIAAHGPTAAYFWQDSLLVAVVLGLSAAVAAQYSMWRPGFHGFLWPALLPYAIALLFHPAQFQNQIYVLTGVMVLIYALGINLISAGLYEKLAENIAMKYDRDEITRDLETARATAEAASRAKSDFLASMSHELRTPLNAILGFSEVMLEEYYGPLSPRYREYCEDVHASARHLLDLINDILDISRIESGRYELDEMPIALGALAETCVRLIRQKAEAKGITVRLSLAATPLVAADERAMRQIAVNLLTNAVKFTPQGGTITIGAGRDEGGHVFLTVTDTGIGIPADELPRITGMYMQGREGRRRGEEGGTGLGLAICQGLVRLHQGEMRIASAPGEGTTVMVRLPPERVIVGDLSTPAPAEAD